MDFIPVPNVLMAELRFTKEAQRVENTLYFQCQSPPDLTIANNVGAALSSWWQTNLRQLTSGDMSLTEVHVTDLSAQESFAVTVPLSPPAQGTAIGESLPSNCALCMSFRTVARGRGGRGRNYVAGSVEAVTTGSFFSTQHVNSVTSAYNILLGAGSFVPGVTWVVVSRHFNKLPRPVGIARQVTAVFSVHNAVDSQRRRLPGRGK